MLLPALGACGGRSSLGHLRFAEGGDVGGTEAVGSGSGGTGRSGGRGGASGGGERSGGILASGGVVRRGGAGGTAGIDRTGGTIVAAGGRLGRGGRIASGGTQGFGGFPAGGEPAGGGGMTGGQILMGGRSDTGGTGGTVVVGGSVGEGGQSLLGGTIGLGGMSGSGGGAIGGNTGQGGTTEVPLTCGDGVLDPDEQCDLGADNDDSPAFSVTQSGRSFAANPLVRDITAVEFYDYRSASSHTGLEELGAGRILLHLYRPELGLSLMFIHGVDEDDTGLRQPNSGVQMKFSGLPDTAYVSVIDDAVSDELWMESTPGMATGWWNFRDNTDGGAFSGLPFPGDWKVEIEPSFAKGITIWSWVQSDTSRVDLHLDQPLFIEARSTPSQCRTNCTVPRCGDGILDGGEVCDPGVRTGYSCSDDCQSFY